jgi:hypothetical protein
LHDYTHAGAFHPQQYETMKKKKLLLLTSSSPNTLSPPAPGTPTPPLATTLPSVGLFWAFRPLVSVAAYCLSRHCGLDSWTGWLASPSPAYGAIRN